MVRFESEEEEEKKTIRKNFFCARAKRHKIYCKTVFDFFSLSRSRSLRSSSSSSRATTPREREREREVRASLQKRSSSLVSRNILVCALSLFFRCCSEYFLFFFFMKRKWIKKSGLWSFQIFRRDFLIQKVPLAFAPFNLRKNSRANDERTNERRRASCERAIAKERRTKRYLYTIGLESFCYGRFESTTTAVRARGANARRPAPKPKRTKQQFRAKDDGKQREYSKQQREQYQHLSPAVSVREL